MVKEGLKYSVLAKVLRDKAQNCLDYRDKTGENAEKNRHLETRAFILDSLALAIEQSITFEFEYKPPPKRTWGFFRYSLRD